MVWWRGSVENFKEYLYKLKEFLRWAGFIIAKTSIQYAAEVYMLRGFTSF